MTRRASTPSDIRRRRRRTQHGCWGQLIVAPLWVAYQANLGTLQRTCDAVGACLAVPDTPHYRSALATGNTLGRHQPCVHRVRGGKNAWVERMRNQGWQVVAIELAEGAISLPRLQPARQPTVVLLGHEHNGVPADIVELADQCVEIPMCGVGSSLNVAVAGSLVLYRLAGMS